MLLTAFLISTHQGQKRPTKFFLFRSPEVLRSPMWVAKGKRGCHWAHRPFCPSSQPAAGSKSRNSAPKHLQHAKNHSSEVRLRLFKFMSTLYSRANELKRQRFERIDLNIQVGGKINPFCSHAMKRGKWKPKGTCVSSHS